MRRINLLRLIPTLLAFAIAGMFTQGEAVGGGKRRDAIEAANDHSLTISQQVKAIRALGKSKDPRAVAALLKRLGCKCDEIQEAATRSLRELKAATLLEKRLLDAAVNEEDRVLATLGLRALKEESSIAPLVQLLKDANPRLRKVAALSLAVIDPSKAEMPLIEALSDDDATVRYYAAQALVKVHTPAVKRGVEARIAVETDRDVLDTLKMVKSRIEK